MIACRRLRISTVAMAALLLPGIAVRAEDRVFALEEIPVLELFTQRPSLAIGHHAVCVFERQPDVRAYPVLKSDKPVYGYVQLGSFMEETKPTLLYYFVADESAGPGTGYDRLYVDLNGDGDLSNDAPVAPRKDVPSALLFRWTSIEGQVLFDNVGFPFPYSSDGVRPLEFVPRLLLLTGDGAMLRFVPAKGRRGRIEIEGRPYDVFLAQTHPICGWFDHAETGFCLTPADGSQAKTAPSVVTPLMAMSRIGQKYYRFSATPAGDELTVRAYEGPMGDFEVGGGPKFKTAEVTAAGWLRSREALVRVESPMCQLPTGDYLLYGLTVTHKELKFTVQRNVHSDGGFRSRLYQEPIYPIRVREGERFVLDFANPPKIVFADPPKDHRIKRGKPLFVEAVLTDPVLDSALSNLRDTSPTPGESSAVVRVRTQEKTLNPRVTIARSGGEIVSEGTMDYG